MLIVLTEGWRVTFHSTHCDTLMYQTVRVLWENTIHFITHFVKELLLVCFAQLWIRYCSYLMKAIIFVHFVDIRWFIYSDKNRTVYFAQSW